LKESYMEDLIWRYPDDFFPARSFKQEKRQYTLPSGGRFDLSFRNAHGQLWLIELKAIPLKIEVVNQVHGYAKELVDAFPGDPPVPMVIAPHIAPAIRLHLDHWGIEYEEIHEATFRRIGEKHGEIEPVIVVESSAKQLAPSSLAGAVTHTTASIADYATYYKGDVPADDPRRLLAHPCTPSGPWLGSAKTHIFVRGSTLCGTYDVRRWTRTAQGTKTFWKLVEGPITEICRRCERG